LRFIGPGYDFTLKGVQAKDRPSEDFKTYVSLTDFTVPQFNFRIGYNIKKNGDGASDGVFLVNMGIVGYLKLSYLVTGSNGGVGMFLATDNSIESIYLPTAQMIPSAAFQNGNAVLQSFFAPSLLTRVGESDLDDATLFTSMKSSEFYYNVGAVPNTDADVVGWNGQVVGGSTNIQ
jgi:hypothetical protein